jgi:hypothetical protein
MVSVIFFISSSDFVPESALPSSLPTPLPPLPLLPLPSLPTSPATIAARFSPRTVQGHRTHPASIMAGPVQKTVHCQ